MRAEGATGGESGDVGAPGAGIRAAGPDDLDAVVALAGTALGWDAGDPNEALFRWKHLENPFGPSALWLGEDEGRLVAFRAFMRWEFDAPDGGRRRAVRAVDTATHPSFQGRGWFRRLTSFALEQERAAGTDFVFNTPNDQSRPGYLKMGWEPVGPVPVAVGVASPSAAWRMRRARVPAGKWSRPTDVGEAAAAVLADPAPVEALLGSQPPAAGLRTARSISFLRWRYAAGPVAYRALLRTSRVEDGVAFFRLRNRGAAVEATLCDVIVPGDDPDARRALVRAIRRSTGADYVIRVQRPLVRDRLVRLPRQGPLLTWRAVGSSTRPAAAAWDLRLGDVELF